LGEQKSYLKENENVKGKVMRKTMIVLGIMLFCAVGFMLLGILIDISIILKYDYTPISFTRTFLFIGALMGLLLAFITVRHLNGDSLPRSN
jgi:Ca2+/Na+ antiporter